jgi:hypothetical protein
MKDTDDVPTQRNGCEDEKSVPETGFSDPATNDREYGGQVGASEQLYAKNIHSAVKPILPAESPTDTSALALYKQEGVKKSPHNDDNKNEGLEPGQGRRHFPLHDLLYANNDHGATLHENYSTDNAVDDKHLHDVQDNKDIDSMTRLLAGYGT